MKRTSIFLNKKLKFELLLILFLIQNVNVYANPKIDPNWTIEKQRNLVNAVSQNKEAKIIYGSVIKRLKYNGLPYVYVQNIFQDSRLTIKMVVADKWNKPAEKTLNYEEYRKIFVNEKRINAGKEFYEEHKELLDTVSKEYQVDPFLILSLIGVETFYGKYSHSIEVLNALHTTIHLVPKKSKWVEDEMVAWIMFCHAETLDPYNIKGSYAGAFGFGQFIPTSYRRYAQDVNGDGIKDPFEWADTFGSISNYLLKRGKYVKTSDDFSFKSANWNAIYKYNPSNHYVKAVLELRTELMKEISNT